MLTIDFDYQGTELSNLVKSVKKELTLYPLLDAIGLKHLNWINRNFRQGGLEEPWKPLSPNTLASRKRGGNQILRDTGRLAQSFVHKVDSRKVRVGTPSEIAPYHQEGTPPYKITPKNGGLLSFITAGGPVFAKSVNHPGLPKRALLPSEGASEEMAVDVVTAAIKKIGK